ncbi:hypothetical protein LuPra_03763 [Luteitalea pratensis]|uniref:Uncharacterized protein n=1 Tax=Luteitalea pratensis TaxID=1855912 RepID=A0A143PPA2_LUTPR|nr:hypothetical protein [Luteitalea pratensis]AMY10527.1 hypothetical protein LuPra_03763 [Luteitalea pratensis]
MTPLRDLLTNDDLHAAVLQLRADLIKLQVGTMLAMTLIDIAIVAALKVFA